LALNLIVLIVVWISATVVATAVTSRQLAVIQATAVEQPPPEERGPTKARRRLPISEF
jgi:hypothetical protein